MRMRAINFTVKYVVHAGPPIHRQFTNFPENQLTTVYAFIYLCFCSFHVHES